MSLTADHTHPLHKFRTLSKQIENHRFFTQPNAYHSGSPHGNTNQTGFWTATLYFIIFVKILPANPSQHVFLLPLWSHQTEFWTSSLSFASLSPQCCIGQRPILFQMCGHWQLKAQLQRPTKFWASSFLIPIVISSTINIVNSIITITMKKNLGTL